jgi:hypothetical protein
MDMDIPPQAKCPNPAERYEDLVNLGKPSIFPSSSFNEKPIKITPEFKSSSSSSNCSINVNEMNLSSVKSPYNVSLNLDESKVISQMDYKKINENYNRHSSSKTSEHQFDELLSISVKDKHADPEKLQNSSVLKGIALKENRQNDESLKVCWSGLDSNENTGTRINSVFKTTAGTRINSLFNTTPGTNPNSRINNIEEGQDRLSFCSFQSKASNKVTGNFKDRARSFSRGAKATRYH